MEKRSEILVAVDFTECADAAFEAALGMGSRLDAGLLLVHVIEPLAASPWELVSHVVADGRMREARDALGKLLERARARGIAARTQIHVGPAAHMLLAEIDRAHPALVVVGSHGKGPIRRALLGSVSEALCRRSSAPVLVIPSRRRREHAQELARSCAACGHLLEPLESIERCAACGAQPASWVTAEITGAPADAGEASVSDAARERLAEERTNDPAGLFATSPGGTEGYDVNPELKVRY